MKIKDYILLPLYLIIVIAIIVSVMMGIQYLASMILDLQFTSSYGPIFLSLNIFVGFILLIPISIFTI